MGSDRNSWNFIINVYLNENSLFIFTIEFTPVFKQTKETDQITEA